MTETRFPYAIRLKFENVAVYGYANPINTVNDTKGIIRNVKSISLSPQEQDCENLVTIIEVCRIKEDFTSHVLVIPDTERFAFEEYLSSRDEYKPDEAFEFTYDDETLSLISQHAFLSLLEDNEEHSNQPRLLQLLQSPLLLPILSSHNHEDTSHTSSDIASANRFRSKILICFHS